MTVGLPKSRLLARLDSALARTRDPVDAACLRVERAGFLVRHGHTTEAQAELDAVRAQFAREPHPGVSAWLCIAEGWQLHFGSLSGLARDKMKRAEALSAAAGLLPLQALSAAWLAHMDYCAGDLEGLVHHVCLALRLAADDHHAARARASMVVALAYDFAERPDRAQPWYARTREHALADGDETTQSALNYNISGHRVHHAMQAAVFGGDDTTQQARHALAGAECARNFDQWMGTLSLDALVPMQRACMASMQGRHAEALALYEKHLADAQQQGLRRIAAAYLADMAWCRWHLGDRAGASRDAHAAAGHIDAGMHPDDRAVAHGRLGLVFKLLGDTPAALLHGALGRDFLAQHRQCQAAMFDALEGARLGSP
jgi:hypothetical protein